MTGADGIMIGRAAQGSPWIFGQISHYLRTGETAAEPTARQVMEILLEHLSQLYEFYGETMGTRIARKHIAWYSKRHPGGAQFRERINRTESASHQLQQVRDFFACQIERGELAA